MHFVELRCFFGTYSDVHGDARRFQLPNAFTGNFRVCINFRDVNLRDASLYNCVGAGRRASPMATRFKVHIEGAAFRGCPGGLQRVNLGVRSAGFLMIPFADNLSRFHDNCSDERVWARAAFADFG